MSDFPCPFCQTLRPASTSAETLACPTCKRPPVVCGSYRIDELLGRGGMGIVYGGRRPTDGKPVAIKMLALQFGLDWKGYELFERSTRVLQELRHRALPGIFAFERDEAGRLVLVRERFDGGNLEERIVAGQRRLSPDEFRGLLTRMLELLAYLHGRVPPVLHRDIKAPNIMFRTREDWEPVLVDFDTVAVPGTQIKRTTLVVSPGYTAPEQLTGKVSPASDLFSLGATMLYAATQTHPDELPARDGQFLVAERLERFEPGLRSVLLKLVEPTVARRYGRAEDALRDLVGPSVVRVPEPPETIEEVSVSLLPRETAGWFQKPGQPRAPEVVVQVPPPRRRAVPEINLAPAGPGGRRPKPASQYRTLIAVSGVILVGVVLLAMLLISNERDSSRSDASSVEPSRLTPEQQAEEEARRTYERLMGESAQDGGTDGDVAPVAALPVRETYDVTGRTLWTFKLDGKLANTHTVVGDTLFLDDEMNVLHALDRATGKERWRHEARASGESPLVVRDGVVWYNTTSVHILDLVDGHERSQIYLPASPAEWFVVEGDTAFVLFSDGWLRAYAFPDAGPPLWEFEARSAVRADWSMEPPLAVVGTTAFVGSERGHLQAINTGTRRELWRFTAEYQPYSYRTPSGRLFVLNYLWDPAPNPTIMRELDPATGRVLWEEGLSFNFDFSTDGREPLLFCGANESTTLEWIAIRGAAGPTERHSLESTGAQSTIFEGGYIVFARAGGDVYLVDPETADVVRVRSGLDTASPPDIADGILYFDLPDGRIEAVDATNVPGLAERSAVPPVPTARADLPRPV